jgi:cyclic beta-1,2-glucan synthetase
MGLAAIGRSEEAALLLGTINPVSLCATAEGSARYRGEPYYLAGDVSAAPDLAGRCGWSLYTGAAGWFYLAVTESLVGLRLMGDSFTVSPRLSDAFPSYTMDFTLRETHYTVTARRGDVTAYRLDGKNVNNLFYFDKKDHFLEITVEIFSGLV